MKGIIGATLSFIAGTSFALSLDQLPSHTPKLGIGNLEFKTGKETRNSKLIGAVQVYTEGTNLCIKNTLTGNQACINTGSTKGFTFIGLTDTLFRDNISPANRKRDIYLGNNLYARIYLYLGNCNDGSYYIRFYSPTVPQDSRLYIIPDGYLEGPGGNSIWRGTFYLHIIRDNEATVLSSYTKTPYPKSKFTDKFPVFSYDYCSD